jgi:CubicO group peptidase (beta-lactamase class C family)
MRKQPGGILTGPTLQLLLVFAALCSVTTRAQDAKIQEAIQQADAYLNSQSAGGSFRGSALIGVNGKILFEKGYGFADEEWKTRNDPATKFRIASMTKQFTAACILLLQERGRLLVQEPVSKYVSDLPQAWQPITIHELLTHTSGISNYPIEPRVEKEMNRIGATPRELLEVVTAKPLEFKPGTKMKYTNTGYVLLGMIIEKVSGKSYADFLRENIFEPLGMKDSGYDVASVILDKRASGYFIKDGHVTNADFIDMSVPFAAGGIYSTVEDLYRWNEALAAPGKLLTTQSLAQMFAVYSETTAYGGQNYGYGVVITHRFGKLLYYHGGGVMGFESSIQRYPGERLCIVVLSNLDPSEPWKASDRMASYLFGQPLPATQ